MEQESESAVLWFRQNEIIFNLDKFQTIFLKSESKTKVKWNICYENVNIGIVKLLGIETDKNLTFEIHLVKLCSKAAAQLNVISRLNRYLDKSKTAVIII